MAVSDAEIEFVRDLFADVGDITTRKMFGGLGIYSGGTIFALIGPENKIMVKARDELAAALAEAGATQFTYDSGGHKKTQMPYWTLPDSALDDPSEACDWARKSLQQNG